MIGYYFHVVELSQTLVSLQCRAVARRVFVYHTGTTCTEREFGTHSLTGIASTERESGTHTLNIVHLCGLHMQTISLLILTATLRNLQGLRTNGVCSREDSLSCTQQQNSICRPVHEQRQYGRSLVTTAETYASSGGLCVPHKTTCVSHAITSPRRNVPG